MKVYIHGIGLIAANIENTQGGGFVSWAVPDYDEFVPARERRRMSRLLKVGVYACRKAMADAETTKVDAFITCTGVGFVEETEKFLLAVAENEHAVHSPTAFIQSIHNTLGGFMALSLQERGYNNTFSQRESSVETALLDALGFFYDKNGTALLAAFDEHTALSKAIRRANYKDKIVSEGAVGLVLSTDFPQKKGVELLDVEVLFNESISATVVSSFLQKQQLQTSDVQLVFQNEQNSELQALFNDAELVCYEEKVGSSYISTAFGLAYLYEKMLEQKTMYGLLVNQYASGKGGSLVLVKNVVQ